MLVDMKLEVVVIPVTDVDRAKQFYAGLGWRLDADFPFDNGFRVVQFTPPGPPRPVRPRACTWLSPISRPPSTSSKPAAPSRARSSTPGRPAPSSGPTEAA